MITTRITAPRTIACRLTVLPVQQPLLEKTISAFAGACAYTWQYGQQHQLNQQLPLHKACYAQLRNEFFLPANLAVRAIAWAALHLKQEPAAPCPFPGNQLFFDCRTFLLNAREGSVKLTLVDGQEKFYLDRSSFPLSYLSRLSSNSATLLKRSSGYYLKMPVGSPEPAPPAAEQITFSH